MIPYPGAPPTPPYDNAGWTLAYQMGVQFDRVLEPFTGPFERVTDWNVKPPAGRRRRRRRRGSGYRVRPPASTTRTRGEPAARGRRRRVDRDGRTRSTSAPRPGTLARAAERSRPDARRQRPRGVATRRCRARRLRAPRIGLWDQYGGSMESGWTRWILEQFEFPFERVFAPQLDAGNLQREVRRADLRRRRDSRRRPAADAAGAAAGAAAPPAAGTDVPRSIDRSSGRVTRRRARCPQLRAVHRERRHGDRASATRPMNLAAHLKLPVEDHLVENGAPLPRAKYFVPGSVLSAQGRRHAIRSPPA